MKNFPPYNQSKSDANERATRWAHRNDVETGTQKIIFYHDKCYVIGKYDSEDLKYLIEGRINKKDYIAIRKEFEEDAKHGKIQRKKKMVDFLGERNERRNKDSGRGQSFNYPTVEYRKQNRAVLRLDREQDGKGRFQSDNGRSDERDRENRANDRIDEETSFSLKRSPSKRIQELNNVLDSLEKGAADIENQLSGFVKDGTITTELYNELLESYGAISEGENAHRTVKVPQRTAKDKKVSQTVRTILEAQATPDTAVPTIEKMVEDGVFSYDVYTGKQAISAAAIHL